MDGYEPLARVEDLPAGTLLGVKTADGEHVCLVNDRGTIHAVSGHCSHQEFPLDDGTLMPGGRIECAWHGSQFELATGSPISPPAEQRLAVYRVMVIGGMVCVGDAAHMSALAPRADFPLLAADRSLVYLDSAATAQKPHAVLNAIAEFYSRDYANPHRGAYALSARATSAYRGARQRLARFFGVADDDTFLFTSGCTAALNLVASSWGRANVRAGDRIVVTAAEHHGNFVPWQQLALERGAEFAIAPLGEDGTLDLAALGAMLDARTRVVAFNHVSNVLGAVNPVRAIASLVRERTPNAITVCDGAQAAPHMPVAIDALGVDFYAFGGHKMFGPMGVGVLVGRRALLEAMPPYQSGGDMIEFVHDDQSTWNVLPHKFEAGTPNVEGAVGLAAAADYLGKLGMDAVHAHGSALASRAIGQIERLEGARVFGPPAGTDRGGVVSFTLADVHPHDLSSILDARGICIRAGHHCAQPLMRRLGVGSTARASFSIYNDEHDVDALTSGLRAALELFGHVSV